MGQSAIIAENISKAFHIGNSRSLSLRESLTEFFNGISRNQNTSEEFLALNNINFEIEQGTSVGIIGRNGAGKSTLLKILSRITKPTTGKIVMEGRAASLLEVGTGFHPELTGRENIFLNGVILGMKKSDVRKKFDEIVAFSGVEKFLDTPVKRYSSGMYVRLGFAVAAHLEPEILIIDEVLAVGDAEFQKKCLGKMKDVTKEGRTVLFVSHNMSAILSLCTKSILLVNGSINYFGNSNDTVKEYFKINTLNKSSSKKWEKDQRPKDHAVVMHYIKVINSDLDDIAFVKIGEKFGIEICFEVLENGCNPVANIHLYTSRGDAVFCALGPQKNKNNTMPHTCRVWIPNDFLNAGEYFINAGITSLNPTIIHCFEEELIYFEVVDHLDAVTRRGYKGTFPGVIRPYLEWTDK